MSLHINRFIDRVQGMDLRSNQGLTMSVAEARDLVADLARLVLELNTLRSSAVNNHREEVITVQIDGGTF
jgi:hypothetical protein